MARYRRTFRMFWKVIEVLCGKGYKPISIRSSVGSQLHKICCRTGERQVFVLSLLFCFVLFCFFRFLCVCNYWIADTCLTRRAKKKIKTAMITTQTLHLFKNRFYAVSSLQASDVSRRSSTWKRGTNTTPGYPILEREVPFPGFEAANVFLPVTKKRRAVPGFWRRRSGSDSNSWTSGARKRRAIPRRQIGSGFYSWTSDAGKRRGGQTTVNRSEVSF